MTALHTLKLFQIVTKYIPDKDDSRDFVTEIEAVVQNQLKMETTALATKSELYQVKDELKGDIRVFRDELKSDIHQLRDELKSDIHQLRDELKSDIHQLRVEFKTDMHQLRDELKGDIRHLEVRMETGFKDQLKWIILLMLGFSSLIITVIKFL
jgi:DNA anti-recombination protein RmuC